jgi:hypothetical protein
MISKPKERKRKERKRKKKETKVILFLQSSKFLPLLLAFLEQSFQALNSFVSESNLLAKDLVVEFEAIVFRDQLLLDTSELFQVLLQENTLLLQSLAGGVVHLEQ